MLVSFDAVPTGETGVRQEDSMSLLSKLFRIKASQIQKPNGEPKTSGDLIAEVTEGENLVEGKQTWEYAEEKKHDIEYLLVTP